MNKFAESEKTCVSRFSLNRYLYLLRGVRCGELLAALLWEITDRFCTEEALWTVFAAMALGNGARTARELVEQWEFD